MPYDVDKLTAFRESAVALSAVLREQDREIESIIYDVQQEIADRVRAQDHAREQAEDDSKACHGALWELNNSTRYVSDDKERLEYLGKTRARAVELAEMEAEAHAREQRLADQLDELETCQREVDEAAFKVLQILKSADMSYSESLGMSVMRLEMALEEYYATDKTVSRTR